ncbi:hypothetical protein JR316_0013295 [Psilocybe cubensis]|uniref:Uncharacterized protein n=2 Tax=Psilocybe cubensis TaxID=181762 RepID=A0ACB8GID4_PSICU|nr:hypothetical protein JR316_0013295 [Psilocybe cubensis]KAH9474829.1 hypothetical protein JR316_0013295 [Psilocybe cubensis]
MPAVFALINDQQCNASSALPLPLPLSTTSSLELQLLVHFSAPTTFLNEQQSHCCSFCPPPPSPSTFVSLPPLLPAAAASIDDGIIISLAPASIFLNNQQLGCCFCFPAIRQQTKHAHSAKAAGFSLHCPLSPSSLTNQQLKPAARYAAALGCWSVHSAPASIDNQQCKLLVCVFTGPAFSTNLQLTLLVLRRLHPCILLLCWSPAAPTSLTKPATQSC